MANFIVNHGMRNIVKHNWHEKPNVLLWRKVNCMCTRGNQTLWSMFYHFQVIFLIGNKSDLEAQRDVTYEEAKQFADENGKEFMYL